MNLTLAAVVQRGYIEPCVVNYPVDCERPGLDIDYIANILRIFGIFHLRFILLNETEEYWMPLINGSADMTASSLSDSYIFHHPNPSEVQWLIHGPYDRRLIMAKPKLSNVPSQSILFAVCKPDVWYVLTCTLMAIGALLWLEKRLMSDKSFKVRHVSTVLNLFFGIFFTVFGGAYSNTLSLVLAKPAKFRGAFTSLDEMKPLLKSKQCYLISSEYVDKETIEWNEYNQSMLRFDGDDQALVRYILDKKDECAIGVVYDDLLETLHPALADRIYYPTEEPFSGQNFYLFIQRNHSHLHAVENAMAAAIGDSAMETHIYHKYRNMTLPNITEAASSASDNTSKPSTIGQLQEAFYILMIGCMIALIVHIISILKVAPRRLFQSALTYNLERFESNDVIEIYQIYKALPPPTRRAFLNVLHVKCPCSDS